MAIGQKTSFPGVTRRERQMAQDLSNVLGLPLIRGRWYWVDPKNGSSSNNGLRWNSPLNNLENAYDKLAVGDGVILLPYSSSTTANTTSYMSASKTWALHGITVVGINSRGFYNQRARVSQLSTATMYSLINITGNDNAFYNVSFNNGSDLSDAQICAVKISGGASRNAFFNCDFKGSPATASAYKCDLWLSNAHENTFEKCNFGNASYDAGNNAACHIYIDGTAGNGQNMFRDCTGIAQVSTGTAFGGVKSGSATSLNGAMLFINSYFTVWQANVGIPAMASWFIGTKPNTGFIMQPVIIGYAAGDSVAGNDMVISWQPDAAAGGPIGVATA